MLHGLTGGGNAGSRHEIGSGQAHLSDLWGCKQLAGWKRKDGSFVPSALGHEFDYEYLNG